MSQLQKYTQATIYIDGALLTEESKVTVKRTTGSQQVITVAKGYAGESPGAPMMEVTVESAVPSADFELNPGRFMTGLEPCELTVFAAGKTLTTKGFIVEDDFSHAANSPSQLSFTFRGPYQDWK